MTMIETYQPLFVREGHAEAWRPWFAWRPVWVADLRWPYPRQKRVWFQRVLRRRFHAATWFLDGFTWWWQYAPSPALPTIKEPTDGPKEVENGRS